MRNFEFSNKFVSNEVGRCLSRAKNKSFNCSTSKICIAGDYACTTNHCNIEHLLNDSIGVSDVGSARTTQRVHFFAFGHNQSHKCLYSESVQLQRSNK